VRASTPAPGEHAVRASTPAPGEHAVRASTRDPGAAAAPPGRFLYATGFSGHGFQQAPAVGEIVRDLYLGSPPFVDVSALSAGRGERPERNVV